MKRIVFLVPVVVLFACASGESDSGAPEPSDNFQSTVGDPCEQDGVTIDPDPSDPTEVTITIAETERTTRTVTDDNGFLREQTVISCRNISCLATGVTDIDAAVRACRS